MIPDEAVEALAQVLAMEALVEADIGGYGWNAETDSPERFMPRARERAREYLEAAFPHLTPNMEWAIFRASDGPEATPMENRRYRTREIGERELERDYRQPEFLEVRGRLVGEWANDAD